MPRYKLILQRYQFQDFPSKIGEPFTIEAERERPFTERTWYTESKPDHYESNTFLSIIKVEKLD